MRKFLLLIIALLSVASMQAQEVALSDSNLVVERIIIKPQHFGYFSYGQALQSMPEYEAAMEQLAKLKANYDEELVRSERDFSKKFAEFIEGQKNFPQNILLKRQKELQQLMVETMNFKEEAKQYLTQSENELLQPLHDRLAAVIKIVGTEHNLSFILNTDNNAYPFINTTEEAEDCNTIIKEQLQK